MGHPQRGRGPDRRRPVELGALEPAGPAARGELAARAAQPTKTAEGAIPAAIDEVSMKLRWYDWPLLVVFGLPIGIYVAARDLWDGWYYRP